MATILFSNSASATLASSITTSSTTITVSTGSGALFPSVPAGSCFYATLMDSSNNVEIVKVTGRSADSLTVVRAQEGTIARSYAAADLIELRITAAALNDFAQLSSPNTFLTAPTFDTALEVTSGGTGVTTSTGTGNVVLSNNPTLVAPTLGTPASGSLENCTNVRQLTTTNFTVSEAAGKLYFKYNGTVLASLDSSGNLTVLNNITAYGTP